MHIFTEDTIPELVQHVMDSIVVQLRQRSSIAPTEFGAGMALGGQATHYQVLPVIIARLGHGAL